MRLSDFDFDLPPELIAQHPAAERSASRLLDARGHSLSDRGFTDLPNLLRKGDLLVVNDTRVIKARLRGRKASGGRIELMIDRLLDGHRATAQWRASHAPAVDSPVEFEAGHAAIIEARRGGFVTLRFERPVELVLAAVGSLPLPPYIGHAPTIGDEARYQTVYAAAPGAVAAPTAGLHFDERVFADLDAAGVATATLTLHVGAGTFLPVRSETLEEHVMHAESYIIPETLVDAVRAARARGGRVIAVGTTSLRALEAASDPGGIPKAGPAETQLFITPGYRFHCVDLLITNFHLPRSTLLMLVSAFAGVDLIRRAYAHAVAERYRFFSYGDAMLLERA